MADPNPQADPELHHLATQVQIAAVKVKAGASQILLDLSRGRLVPSAGDKLAAEVILLCKAQAVLTQAQKTAARRRGEAAA